MTFRAAGSLTSGDSDAVRFVGPERPGDEARPSGIGRLGGIGGLARQPRRRDVDLLDHGLEAVVGLRDPGRVKVLVSTMSAPASRYAAWMRARRRAG